MLGPQTPINDVVKPLPGKAAEMGVFACSLFAEPGDSCGEHACACSGLEDEAPVGFWSDLAASVRTELNPAMSGFFGTTANSPLRGILTGNTLLLVCVNDFVADIVNKPEVIKLVEMKASAALGRQIRICVTDKTMSREKSNQLEQLLSFGREHSGVVKINDGKE